jgi:hypothetical protein
MKPAESFKPGCLHVSNDMMPMNQEQKTCLQFHTVFADFGMSTAGRNAAAAAAAAGGGNGGAAAAAAAAAGNP